MHSWNVSPQSYYLRIKEVPIVPRKKFVQKKKLYIFEKPLTMPFQIGKKFWKILNNLIFNQEKLKMCKFPLTGCLQKICNFFFAKLVQSFKPHYPQKSKRKEKMYTLVIITCQIMGPIVTERPSLHRQGPNICNHYLFLCLKKYISDISHKTINVCT